MENPSNDYHISFFKPTTEQARMNRNMVIWLVSVWFIAIFGFHFLLRIIEKPTPQPAYIEFQQVWEPVIDKAADEEQMQSFGQSLLSVLGKVAIEPEDKQVLDQALSWTVLTLTPDSLQDELITSINEFKAATEASQNIEDSTYVVMRNELIKDLSPVLGLGMLDIRSTVIPYSLNSEGIGFLSDYTIENLPGVMGKYLIHYQSVLTDTKFLGFPFHYFYTSVFLLILFVVLCWLYCKITDKRNAKLNIVD